MAVQTFAAINVGSYDTTMKIYQIMPRKGYKLLDTVSKHLELGADTYASGELSNETVDSLCDILQGFLGKMVEYDVKEYRAYATSAVREAMNCELALDRIATRTSIRVQTVSNSEHRFMMYEAIADSLKDFDKITAKNTAVLDVGAGSIQITLFDKQKISATQNISIGALRVRENLSGLDTAAWHMEGVMQEYIENELTTFDNFYLRDKEIKHVIGVGEGIHAMARMLPQMQVTDTMNAQQLDYICKKLENHTPASIAEQYGIPYEKAAILAPAALIYRLLLAKAKAEVIYLADVTFCEGMVVDYMDTTKKLTLGHDFQSDIVASAQSIAKRYRCNKQHCQRVVDASLMIFDHMKSIHGLDKRARLQLEIASILHDCGKFVNMNHVADNSFHIVMSTEILGISHQERLEIAYICKYNTEKLPDYKALQQHLSVAQYSKVAKLAAILKVANAMDRSHQQKIHKCSMAIKDKQFVIMADTIHDLSLEAGLFESKADFFEAVYGIRPVLRQRRSI